MNIMLRLFLRFNVRMNQPKPPEGAERLHFCYYLLKNIKSNIKKFKKC